MASDGRAPSIADAPLQTGVSAALSRLGCRLEKLFEAERDQLPLWLPVGLGFGIAAWFALPGRDGWTAFLLASGALFFAFLGARETRWGRALAAFALMAGLGCALIWWKAEGAAAPRLERAQMAEFTARVESFRRVPAKDHVRLVLQPGESSSLPPRLRINVPEEKAAGIEPAATIRLRAWLMPPAPMAVPGAYDFARVAWFQGIGGTGRALGEVEIVSPVEGQGFGARIADARQRLADYVAERLSGGEGGIAVALATGDQGAISEGDAEAMRRSGLAHLLSVSGLHLTAAVGAVMLLTLKLLALSPTLALR